MEGLQTSRPLGGPEGVCLACGAPALAAWRLASTSEPVHSRRSQYPLERCRQCGSAMIAGAERSPESDRLYDSGTYLTGRGRAEWVLERIRRLIDRDRVRLLGRLHPGSRVFEVGAGDGRFLAELARAGHHVAGIEPSPDWAEAAAQRDVPVSVVGVEAAADAVQSQDAVLAWHVVEHLDDPQAAVRRMRTWLRPGGLLLVGVPNLGSLQARLGGDRWFHQDVPRHRVHFTVPGIRALLERSGFEVVSVHHAMLEHNLLGMWQTLLNRLTSRPDAAFRFLKRQPHGGGPREARRDAAIVAAAGPPLALVSVLLELGAALLGRGGTVAVRAVAR